MDQEGLNGGFCPTLALAFELEELDLSGDSSIGDDGIVALPRGEMKNEEGRVLDMIGLPKLKVLKLGGMNKITDHSLIKLVHTSKVIEHLELTKCDLITEYSIDNLLKTSLSLKFLDLNGIPAITPAILDALRQLRPDIMIRRFLYQNVDPKDNGLRVPRRVVDKKKKKKKGKKGGGKKKK